MMTDSAPPGGASSRYCQSSSTISRRRSSLRIHALLERLHADATHGVDERLVLMALLAIDSHDARNGLGNLALPHGRADDFAQSRETVDRAPNRDLVPLLTMLIDTQNTNVPNMMMSAGI